MSRVHAARASMTAGGGAFVLPHLTIGVFLVPQPNHRMSVGADRLAHIPLGRNDGWIQPAGGEGVCAFDAPLTIVTATFDSELLSDVGLTEPGRVAPFAGPLDPMLVQMTLRAPDFAQGGALYRETMEQSMAAHLVHCVAPVPQESAGIDDPRLRRAIDYIEDALGEDVSLREMAGRAGMSAPHFARAFKAAMGASPLQYVIGRRVDRARILLRTTRLAIAEIAWRVGYEDLSRFGRHFKRRVGATPKAYRDSA